MAKRRDIVIGVVIVISFLVAFGFMGLMFVGVMSGDSDFNISGMGGNIGIVEVFGAINESTGRRAIYQLEEWAEDNSIQAIVVHVNSPGGGVAISQEIYDTYLQFLKYGGFSARGFGHISDRIDQIQKFDRPTSCRL